MPVLPGDAAAIPLADGSVDAIWLSTVVHHIPDLDAAAREMRRVIRPGGAVLIRSAFPGRLGRITLFRYFPEAVPVLDTYPSVATVCAAHARAGFAFEALESVPQTTYESLNDAVAAHRREAHTPLKLMSDEDYDRGLARMRAAAKSVTVRVRESCPELAWAERALVQSDRPHLLAEAVEMALGGGHDPVDEDQRW